MAKVIGFVEKVFKTFECDNCDAIVEYESKEDQYTNEFDPYGTRIKGLKCPNCGEFHRTNY